MRVSITGTGPRAMTSSVTDNLRAHDVYMELICKPQCPLQCRAICGSRCIQSELSRYTSVCSYSERGATVSTTAFRYSVSFVYFLFEFLFCRCFFCCCLFATSRKQCSLEENLTRKIANYDALETALD